MDTLFTVQLEPGEGKPVTCKVLEAVPYERLSYSWVSPRPNPDAPLDTIVTFELARTPDNGTRLLVTHAGRDVRMRMLPVTNMKASHNLAQIGPHGRKSGRKVRNRPEQYPRQHQLMSTSMRRAA
jgi:uncharacterized protein YndB with AHSA1/START domain